MRNIQNGEIPKSKILKRNIPNIEVPPEYHFKPFWEAVIIGTLILIATTHANYFLFQKALEAQKGEIHDGLKLLSKTLIRFIDEDSHQLLISPEQQNSPTYLQALLPLTEVMLANREIVNAYTMVRRNEQILFVLDATPAGDIDGDGQEDKAHLMEVYDDPPSELILAFNQQQFWVTREPYQDKWGEYFSCFMPLINKQGEVYGMLGLDLSAQGYQKRLYPIQRHFIRTSAVSVFIAFIVSCLIWFLRRFCQVLHQKRMQLINLLPEE